MNRYARGALLVAACAVVHAGITLLTISQGLIIFRGPSTPAEKFWDGAMQVMLFPGSMLLDAVHGNAGQVVLVIANSLLWGMVLAWLVVHWRKRRVRGRSM